MDYNQQPYFSGGSNPTSAQVTTHLNSIMKRVYIRMCLGLLITAFVSLGLASTPSMHQIVFNPLVYWGSFIGMLIMALVIPARLTKMSTTTCLLLYGIFCLLMGVSLTSIFIVYSIGTITSTFFMTAGVFGAMSVYGYFTKSDLSKIGTYLMMALFGLIIVMIVNIFLNSSTVEWVISIFGVLIFTGLTAWDTQQMRRLAAANLDPALTDKLATYGALNLYLDFINLFLFILRFFGGRD